MWTKLNKKYFCSFWLLFTVLKVTFELNCVYIKNSLKTFFILKGLHLITIVCVCVCV